MTEPFRYKPRREKLHIDDPGLLETITKLSFHLGLSKSHIADLLNVGRSTFYDFLKDNPEAEDAFNAGRAAGRLDFAQTGLLHARADPATWRQLSKHKRFLGLSDEPKTKAPEAPPVDGQGTPMRRLSREELEGRIIELSAKVTITRPSPKPSNNATTGKGLIKRG